MRGAIATALIATVLGSLALASSAAAAPSFALEAARNPTTVRQNDEQFEYNVNLKNTGANPTVPTTTLSLSLSDGLQMATGNGTGWSCQPGTQTCTSEAAITPGAQFAPLTLKVWVLPGAAPNPSATFTASGGGASGEAALTDAFAFVPAVPFGIASMIAGACTAPAPPINVRTCAEAEAGGAVALAQAGAHPFAATSSFSFPTRRGAEGIPALVESLRDLIVDLPPGFVGNPEAIGQLCSVADVRESTGTENRCPETAAVGGVGVEIEGASSQRAPLYRVFPEEGYAAAFAFRPSPISKVTIVIRAKLRSNGDYGVSAVAPLAPQAPPILGIEFTTLCGYGAKTPPGEFAPGFGGCRYPGTPGANAVPFLSNPTSCPGTGPLTVATVDSFQRPGLFDGEGFPAAGDPNWKPTGAASLPTVGCNQLEFQPSFEGRPSTSVADAPTGLDFHLHLPQEGLVGRIGLAEAHLKDTTVVLPSGLTVNPAAATGLEACGSAQIGLLTAVGQTPAHFSVHPDNCPAAAKIGTVEVKTPLLSKPLLGSLYLAKQYDNPFHSLLALYISIDDPETGIVAKLPGRVIPDPTTGQITTTFEENPQVPFEDLELHTFQGPRASLRTPPTCGLKATSATFTPWSAPESGPPVSLADHFETTTAPGGGTCPTSAAQMPNAPSFSAGTVSPKAGAYSPFVLRLARDDGSQEIKGINTVLPPGLTGRLAGTPPCSDAQLAVALSRSKPGEGVLEQSSPSCPAASEVGSVEVSAGAGPAPYHASGKAYLTGPYKGAPVSLTVITPAVAGPFDLGTVAIRNPLYINPVTAQVTVKSDPIPTILEGVPLDVRSIEVRVTRDRFTLNPTSCNPMTIGATALGLNSDAALSNRFQVGECGALGFKPGLKLQLRGGTRRGAHPGLRAVLQARPGDANIGSISVALPHSAFLEQAHIRTICTRVQFAAKACPAGSVYGHVSATSPLVDYTLEGPVYLRSSSNPLPDLVAVVRGPDSQPIEIAQAGRIDSVHGGIRNTFETFPDAPVSKVVLEMPGGRKSLIVNSRDLCKGKKQRATVKLIAQNGMKRDFRPVVGNGCKKKSKHKHKR